MGKTMVDLAKVRSMTQWRNSRPECESVIRSLLGEMPEQRADVQVKVVDEESFDAGYVRKRINCFVEDWERTAAWLFVPEDREDAPGIVCCHSAVPQGKKESSGIDGDPLLAFAQHYAERGYITIAPDCISMGERTGVGKRPFDMSVLYKEHPNLTPLGKMLWDHFHAIDALCETRGIDLARIGVIGHEMGGVNALMLTAFDERIQACVASNAFTRFADDDHPEHWIEDDPVALLPTLADAIEKKEFPFDWEHVLALAAPSPVMLLTGLNDPNLSNPKSCEKAVKKARKIYKLLGAPDALENVTHASGQGLSPELLAMADEWFERWL